MPVRSTMATLILRVRTLINDPAGASEQFSDQIVQDILDASRQDVKNAVLIPKPTFAGSTIQYLDYYSDPGLTDWEDDLVLKQYLVNVVTPSLSEPIAGHWQFAASTLPPVYISGKSYDIYRAAADLLERWAAAWVLRYSMSVDGQNLQRGQVTTALQALAKTFRLKQRARTMNTVRSDLNSEQQNLNAGLGPLPIDFYSDGAGH